MTETVEQDPRHAWLKVTRTEGASEPAYFHECDPEGPDGDLGVTSYFDPHDKTWWADRILPAQYCPGCGVRLADFRGD